MSHPFPVDPSLPIIDADGDNPRCGCSLHSAGIPTSSATSSVGSPTAPLATSRKTRSRRIGHNGTPAPGRPITDIVVPWGY